MTYNDITRHYIASLKGLIDIDVIYGSKRDVLLRGSFCSSIESTEANILKRISALPGKAEIISIEPRVVIRVQMPGIIAPNKIPWLNVILFVLTLFSTIIVGAANAGIDFFSDPDIFWTDPVKIILAGIPFSFSLLGILLFHEFGHYIASRIHGVKVTLPYFIPFPNFIGTMGAVIRSKSPFITRKQLFDVGAAGPLSGIVIAIPVVMGGLAHPNILPETTDLAGLIRFGDSLLVTFISMFFHPPIPEGYIAVASPVAFAGWVGLFVTMLNLLPIGQLDGGHILYAMFGNRQHKIAYISLLALVALSFLWIGWIFWAFLGLFLIKPPHPPTVLDDLPIDRKRMLIGYICIIVFILCFIPTPFMAF